MTTQTIKKQIVPILKRQGVTKAALFGSCARGEVKKRSKENFSQNITIQDAVIRRIEIIGEAVRNIPKEIKTKNPNVAWNEIKGMRNKVVHEYFGIDEEILWKTIQDDLPIFKKQIAKLLKDAK